MGLCVCVQSLVEIPGDLVSPPGGARVGIGAKGLPLICIHSQVLVHWADSLTN